MSRAGEAVTAAEADDLDVERAVDALREAAGGTEYEALHARGRAARHLNYVATDDPEAVAPYADALVDALRDERDLTAGTSAAKFGLRVRSHRILTALVQALEELYYSDAVDLADAADGVLLAAETLELLRSVDEEYHDRYAVLHSFNQAAAATPERAIEVAPYMERQLERPPASARRFQETIRYWAALAGTPDTATALSPVIDDLLAIVETAQRDDATDCTPRHRFYATIALRRYDYNTDDGDDAADGALPRDRAALVDLVDALRADADAVRFTNFDYPTGASNLLGAVTHDLWNTDDVTSADATRLFETLEDVTVVDDPGLAAQLLNGIDAVATESPTAVAEVVPELSPYLKADVERVQIQAFHVVQSATPALLDAVLEVAPDVLDAGLASSSAETRQLAASVVVNLAQDAPEAISEYADRIQRFSETSEGQTRVVLFNAFRELSTYLDDDLSILTQSRDEVHFSAADSEFGQGMTQFMEFVEDEAGQTSHQVRVDQLVAESDASEHLESVDDEDVQDRLLPALSSDDASERRSAISFFNTLAMEDPARFWEHVDGVCERLGDLRPSARKALLVGLGQAVTYSDDQPPDRVLSLDLEFLGDSLDDLLGLLEFVDGVTAKDYDAATEYVFSNASTFEAMLTHERPFVRARSTSVVGLMIREAPSVGVRFADTFAANTTDETPFVRDASVNNFSDLAALRPDAVVDHAPTLVDRLDDRDAGCRYHALVALRTLATEHDIDVPLDASRVEPLLEDTSPKIRSEAIHFLSDRALEDPDAVVDSLSAIRARLADDAEDVRTMAAIALLPFVEAEQSDFDVPVERLLSMLEDGSDERRFFALVPLVGALGDDPETLVDRVATADLEACFEWSRDQHADHPEDALIEGLYDVTIALFVLAVTGEDAPVERDVRERLAADARDRLHGDDGFPIPEAIHDAATDALDDVVRSHTMQADFTESVDDPFDALTDPNADTDAVPDHAETAVDRIDAMPTDGDHDQEDDDGGTADSVGSDADKDGFVVGLTKQRLPRDHPGVADRTPAADESDAAAADSTGSGRGELPALDATVLGEALRDASGEARQRPLAALAEVAERRPDAVTPHLDAVVDAVDADGSVRMEALWVCYRVARSEAGVRALGDHVDAIADQLAPRPTGLLAAHTFARIGYHDPDPVLDNEDALATMARQVVAVNLAGTLADHDDESESPFDRYPAAVTDALPSLDADAVTESTDLEFMRNDDALRASLLPLSVVVDQHADVARDPLHDHLDLFAAASWLQSIAPITAQSFASLAVAHGEDAIELLEGFLARLAQPADHHVDTVEAFAKTIGATATNYDDDAAVPYDHDDLAAVLAALLDGSVAITDRTRLEILKGVELLSRRDPTALEPHLGAIATALDRATAPRHERYAAQTLLRVIALADDAPDSVLSVVRDTLTETDDENVQTVLATLLRDLAIMNDTPIAGARRRLADRPHQLVDALPTLTPPATRAVLDCIGALAQNGYRDPFAPHWVTVFEQVAADDPPVAIAALRATDALGSPRDPQPVVDHLDDVADTLESLTTDDVDDDKTRAVITAFGTVADPLVKLSPASLAPQTDAIADLLPATSDGGNSRRILLTVLNRVIDANPDELPEGLVQALVDFAADRNDDPATVALKLLQDLERTDDRHDDALMDAVVPALADWTDGRLAYAALICGDAANRTPAAATDHLGAFADLASHDDPTVRLQALRVLSSHAVDAPSDTLPYRDVFVAHLDDVEDSRLSLDGTETAATPSYEALRGLDALADHAPDAIVDHAPDVVDRTDAPAAPTRRVATKALAALARETPSVAVTHRDAVVARLTDPDPGTERLALDIYQTACEHPDFEPTSDDLLAVLDPSTPDENDATRVTVAGTALEHVAHDALDDPDAVRAALRTRASDTDVDVTFPAIDALLTIDSPTAV